MKTTVLSISSIEYESPEVSVINIQVEKGFAQSEQEGEGNSPMWNNGFDLY